MKPSKSNMMRGPQRQTREQRHPSIRWMKVHLRVLSYPQRVPNKVEYTLLSMDENPGRKISPATWMRKGMKKYRRPCFLVTGARRQCCSQQQPWLQLLHLCRELAMARNVCRRTLAAEDPWLRRKRREAAAFSLEIEIGGNGEDRQRDRYVLSSMFCCMNGRCSLLLGGLRNFL